MSASSTPALSVAEIVAAMNQLTDVLDRETAALAIHDRAALRALFEEKRLACQAYEDGARALEDSGMASADPAAGQALRLASECLTRASAENQRRLAAAIAAQQRVLDIIAQAVRQHSSGAATYTNDGGREHPRRVSAAPLALSFNRAC